MKKILILTLLLNLSQQIFPQSEDDYFLETTKGEKIKLSNTFYKLSAQFLFYDGKDGKEKKIAQSKIKYISAGRKYYFKDKIGSSLGFNRLHELICQNKKYRLSQYFSHGMFYLYLFDKDKEKYIYKKERIKGKTKADKKLFIKKIKPYFSDCKKLIGKINKNLSVDYKPDFLSGLYFDSKLLSSISNYNCE